jgi:hypothetical protein
MPNTIRGQRQLLDALADNDQGLITAQTLRDVVVTTMARGLPNVQEYGAVGDGETDDTEALQRALDDNREGMIYLPITHAGDAPHAGYLVSDTLISRGTALWSTGARIISEPCGAKPAIHFEMDRGEGRSIAFRERPLLENLRFEGLHPKRFRWKVEYTPDSSAVSLQGHEVAIRNCLFLNYYTPIVWGNNTYICNLVDCIIRFCEYGLHFDGLAGRVFDPDAKAAPFYADVGYKNSGENMKIIRCCMCNNNYGLWLKNGEWFVLGTSLDYNEVAHIKELYNNPYSASSYSFIQCHFESTTKKTPPRVARIGINGRCTFDHCFFYEEDAQNLVMFELRSPYADLTLGTNFIFPVEMPPLVSGPAGQVRVTGPQLHRLGGQIVPVHHSLSRVENADFQTGSLDGWEISGQVRHNRQTDAPRLVAHAELEGGASLTTARAAYLSGGVARHMGFCRFRNGTATEGRQSLLRADSEAGPYRVAGSVALSRNDYWQAATVAVPASGPGAWYKLRVEAGGDGKATLKVTNFYLEPQ